MIVLTSSLKKILVCLDGTTNSEKCVKLAVKIAKKFNSEIFLINVIEPSFLLSALHPSLGFGTELPAYPSVHNAASSTVIKDMLDKKRKNSNKIFKKHSKNFENSDISYKTSILLGDVSKEILDFAKKRKIDCIIVGTHEKGKISRVFLGSVATTVSQKAECSVIIAK